VLPIDRRHVHHPYSDLPQHGIEVSTYCFEEVFAEKVRALAERLRFLLLRAWRLTGVSWVHCRGRGNGRHSFQYALANLDRDAVLARFEADLLALVASKITV